MGHYKILDSVSSKVLSMINCYPLSKSGGCCDPKYWKGKKWFIDKNKQNIILPLFCYYLFGNYDKKDTYRTLKLVISFSLKYPNKLSFYLRLKKIIPYLTEDLQSVYIPIVDKHISRAYNRASIEDKLLARPHLTLLRTWLKTHSRNGLTDLLKKLKVLAKIYEQLPDQEVLKEAKKTLEMILKFNYDFYPYLNYFPQYQNIFLDTYGLEYFSYHFQEARELAEHTRFYEKELFNLSINEEYFVDNCLALSEICLLKRKNFPKKLSSILSTSSIFDTYFDSIQNIKFAIIPKDQSLILIDSSIYFFGALFLQGKDKNYRSYFHDFKKYKNTYEIVSYFKSRGLFKRPVAKHIRTIKKAEKNLKITDEIFFLKDIEVKALWDLGTFSNSKKETPLKNHFKRPHFKESPWGLVSSATFDCASPAVLDTLPFEL